MAEKGGRCEESRHVRWGGHGVKQVSPGVQDQWQAGGEGVTGGKAARGKAGKRQVGMRQDQHETKQLRGGAEAHIVSRCDHETRQGSAK